MSDSGSAATGGKELTKDSKEQVATHPQIKENVESPLKFLI